MLNLLLKHIDKVLNDNGDAALLCEDLGNIFIEFSGCNEASIRLIELWNNTFFCANKEHPLSLARSANYKQNCVILLSANSFYYEKFSECENFEFESEFSRGSLCKAFIAFFREDILSIEHEIKELMDNNGFVEKEKKKLLKTMHCLIDILNDNEPQFKENIQSSLMIDKQYISETGIKYALISTAILRLARFKNRNWSLDNELVNQFLVERDFYLQRPSCWSKDYFKDELSQITSLIK